MSMLPDPSTAGLTGWHGGAYQGRPGRGWWPRTWLVISTAVFAVAALAGCSSGHTTGKSAAPATASPSPSPSGTDTAWVCVKSDPKGGCVPSRYPGVTGTASVPYVAQNEWGTVAGETQTLSANSPGDWKVVNSTPAGHGGSVTTFPDTGAAFNEAPLSGYSSVTSSFTETMPHNSATSAWPPRSVVQQLGRRDHDPARLQQPGSVHLRRRGAVRRQQRRASADVGGCARSARSAYGSS